MSKIVKCYDDQLPDDNNNYMLIQLSEDDYQY